MTHEEILQKIKDITTKIVTFIKKWTDVEVWKDLFIPENQEEHPRMVRFLWVVLILVCIMIAIISIITFTIIRMSIPTVRVPAVTKMDMTDAIIILQSEKLQPHFEMVYDDKHYKYQIISQYPNQGASVREGRSVNLIVSLGRDQYTVPKLCELSKEEAVTILDQARIPYSIQVVPAGTSEVNKVVAMSVPVGETVPRDTILTFTVTDSILANQYRMNNFIRQPLEFAANTLFNSGILPIIITTNVDSLSDEGLVLDQNVDEGAILQKNTSAILTVGLYAYNEGDREKQKWHFFNFNIPKVDGQQIIVTNDSGELEDLSIGEQRTAKFYRAVVEDELGRTTTIYERMGAEGTSFNRVFKAYGRAKVYVYADEVIIGSREYGK